MDGRVDGKGDNRKGAVLQKPSMRSGRNKVRSEGRENGMVGKKRAGKIAGFRPKTGIRAGCRSEQGEQSASSNKIGQSREIQLKGNDTSTPR